MLRKFLQVLGFAVVISVFLTLLIMNLRWRGVLERAFGPEIYKMNYQFVLITVLGGAVAGLYRVWSQGHERRIAEQSKERERRVAEQRAWDRERRKVDSDFNYAVNRILKLKYRTDVTVVKVLNHEKFVLREEYDAVMSAFTDLMLRFQTLKRRIEVSPETLYGKSRKEKLDKNLEIIMGYLNDMVNEYDDPKGDLQWSGDPVVCRLDRFKHLKDLYLTGSDFARVAETANVCSAELQDALLHPE